jgi:hemolysin III
VESLPTVLARPRWRGVLHAGAFPLSVVLGLALVVAADGPEARISSAVYAFSCCLLFGVSALYHRGDWSPQTRVVLQRLDHSNIFVIIAGTYTPFAVLALSGLSRELVLATVWAGAVAGTLLNLTWPTAPRWLNVPLYLALGWVALPLIPSLVRDAGWFATALIAVGGIFYTLGAVVYARRRPDPDPAVFGYHEVFHAFTLAGYLTHYVAVAIVVLGAN